MSTTLAAEWHVDEPQLRVTESDARAALRAVTGKPVIPARARLRFGPGRTCEAIARLLDRAIVRAESAGLDPQLLVVADGSAEAGEDIVRVRRKAHGVADWIHSPTCRVRIVLRPAGLHTAGRAATPSRPPADLVAPVPAAEPSGDAAIVRDALAEVIDPDLGVNIVDLGFVRGVVRRADRGHHHDAHLGGLPAHRRTRGPDPRRTRPARLRRRLPRRLAMGTGLAARRHHRQRPRTAARHRLHHLIGGLRVARPR